MAQAIGDVSDSAGNTEDESERLEIHNVTLARTDLPADSNGAPIPPPGS